MASNAAPHGTAGLKNGVTGSTASVAPTAPAALLNGGAEQANGADDTKVKTAKELEKEKKKAEKQKKFDAKKAKAATAASTSATSKSKDKKVKAAQQEEVLPEYEEATPAGQKKILNSLEDPYHKAYIPKVVESGWYAWWEKEGFFKPELGGDGKVKSTGCFVIPEPPPNVTGSLHMGHALPNALQDTLIRWNRMRGLTTLWVPGCDHASISTQVVVEKRLKRQGITRQELGREKFIQEVFKWKEEKKSDINNAIRRMGGSLDWSRERFTMDEMHTKATIEQFVRLHDQGLIYRENRLVNWCTALKTSISNLEMDNKELEGRTLMTIPGYERKVEFGVMHHFNYPIVGSDEVIEIATTRPETMLGDTGIAVFKNAQRWKHLIGKQAKHPFIEGRLLPIFADEHVKEGLGTEAMKVTPAHDPADYDIGRRHKLPFINIFTDDGLTNESTGSFAGMKRYDARYKVIQALTETGLYVKSESKDMVIPICQKSGDVIEQILKPQWWMKMRGMADAAMEAVHDGRIKIRPESAERDYFRWLKDIIPWCISRQLWWGHRIPAYYVAIEGQDKDYGDGARWIAARNPQEAEEKARARFPNAKFTLEQDEDVFDTWFTSCMWPYSIMGWPDNTQDMKLFYPTSLLETGWDILFFWVARMIMLGLTLTGEVPFREVYCHSLVRDSEGRKMSKSLGNVIDPLDVMEGITLPDLNAKLLVGNLDQKELATATKFQRTSFPDGIPECGADALRFSLINYTTGGGDINFDIRVMHGYRRFCNKIYQATKYVLSKIPADFEPLPTPSLTGKESVAEKWILHKFNTAADEVNKALAARDFSDATSASYQFWYNNLCDVFIENSKTILQDGSTEEQWSAQQTLYTALEGGLKLIHPFMPFLTEELWQRLPRRPGDSCRTILKAKYPEHLAQFVDPKSEAAYELVLAVTRPIRSLASRYGIKQDAEVYIEPKTVEARSTCEEQLPAIKSLGGKVTFGPSAHVRVLSTDEPRVTGCVAEAVGAVAAVYLVVKGRVDIDQEIDKAHQRLTKANETVTKQKKLMSGDGWSKIKEEAQKSETQKLEESTSEVAAIEESIQQLQRLKVE